VGNLTVCGTGKTPMVAWLARQLRELGVRVALVSRGYRAEEEGRNDEALELELRLPDVPHVQNADRVAASRLAIEEFDTQLILLDDAFQHRRLHRDLDIVLLDALQPFGFGHLLPRGLLRERMRGLRRADLVVISRANLVSESVRNEIWRTVATYQARVPRIEAAQVPQLLRSAAGQERSMESLRGAAIVAFCGIGNPQGFQLALERCGAQLLSLEIFPDHHPYRRADVERLAAWTSAHRQAACAVCTEKDLVKLGVDRLGDMPLFALRAGIEIMAGGESLRQRLQQLAAAADRS
jgi:tetraacyldisaccharide 4'-kinase